MEQAQSKEPQGPAQRNRPGDFLVTASPDTYPIIVLQDRYGGTYSGGAWLAVSVADRLENGLYRVIRCLEGGPSGDDLEAQDFWGSPPEWIEAADTPDHAVARLRDKVTAQFEADASAELDAKIREGLDDLAAGRALSLEEVEAALKVRFTPAADAAE
jgi:predicted transcriptional regulator